MKQKGKMLNTLLLLWCLLGVFVGPGGAAQSSACSVSHQSGSSGAGQRPLDTTTVSLNNVLLHWSLPPTLHLCLFLPPPRSSLPSSDSKDEDWFLSPPPLPSSTLRELFVVAKWLWCKHVAFDNQTDVIVFVCLLLHPVLPRSAWLCIQLFVRPAEQEKTREKWIKASFLSVLWQDLGLFIAVLADREMNIQLNKTSDLDKTPFMVQFYKTHNTRRPLQTKIDFNESRFEEWKHNFSYFEPSGVTTSNWTDLQIIHRFTQHTRERFYNIQLVFFLLIAHLCLKLIVVTVGAVLSCVALCCKPHTMKASWTWSTTTVFHPSFILNRHPSVMSRSRQHIRGIWKKGWILASQNIHKARKTQWQCVCRAADCLFDHFSWLHVFMSLFWVIPAVPNEREVCVLVV